jgi:NAD-dependent SIR2 family protein deacetylase
LEGRCPKCGRHYYGWALKNTERQKCGQCESPLYIIVESVIIHTETAPQHYVNDVKPTKHFQLYTPSTWKIKKEEESPVLT